MEPFSEKKDRHSILSSETSGVHRAAEDVEVVVKIESSEIQDYSSASAMKYWHPSGEIADVVKTETSEVQDYSSNNASAMMCCYPSGENTVVVVKTEPSEIQDYSCDNDSTMKCRHQSGEITDVMKAEPRETQNYSSAGDSTMKCWDPSGEITDVVVKTEPSEIQDYSSDNDITMRCRHPSREITDVMKGEPSETQGYSSAVDSTMKCWDASGEITDVVKTEPSEIQDYSSANDSTMRCRHPSREITDVMKAEPSETRDYSSAVDSTMKCWDPSGEITVVKTESSEMQDYSSDNASTMKCWCPSGESTDIVVETDPSEIPGCPGVNGSTTKCSQFSIAGFRKRSLPEESDKVSKKMCYHSSIVVGMNSTCANVEMSTTSSVIVTSLVESEMSKDSIAESSKKEASFYVKLGSSNMSSDKTGDCCGNNQNKEALDSFNQPIQSKSLSECPAQFGKEKCLSFHSSFVCGDNKKTETQGSSAVVKEKSTVASPFIGQQICIAPGTEEKSSTTPRRGSRVPFFNFFELQRKGLKSSLCKTTLPEQYITSLKFSTVGNSSSVGTYFSNQERTFSPHVVERECPNKEKCNDFSDVNDQQMSAEESEESISDSALLGSQNDTLEKIPPHEGKLFCNQSTKTETCIEKSCYAIDQMAEGRFLCKANRPDELAEITSSVESVETENSPETNIVILNSMSLSCGCFWHDFMSKEGKCKICQSSAGKSLRINSDGFRKRSVVNNSDGIDDMLDDLDIEIDSLLEVTAQRSKLSVRNVKDILKHVMTNYYIFAMVRNTMEPEDGSVDIGSPTYEPKLTRSKTKELREKNAQRPCLIPSIAKQSNNSTSAKVLEMFSDHDSTSDKECRLEKVAYRIAIRTYSKVQKYSTPLEAVEAPFVVSDATVDMFDADSTDQEWRKFLHDLAKPLDLEDQPDDAEEDDPDYEILEVSDEYDINYDKDINIPKAELKALMRELLEAAQQDLVDIAEEDRDLYPPPSVWFPAKENMCQSENTFQMLSRSMTVYEKLQLQEQMRMHIQLLCQTYLLSKDYPFFVNYGYCAKDMLTELKTLANHELSNGKVSSFNAANLDGAMKIVNQFTLSVPALTLSNVPKARKTHGIRSIKAKKIMAFDKTFIYPDLLPSCSFRKYIDTIKTVFTVAEDNLIALGLEQFSEMERPIRLIYEYMLPTKTEQQIRFRIKNAKSMKHPLDNPIRYFYTHGKCQPFPRTVRPFNPYNVKTPAEMPLTTVPRWMRPFHARQHGKTVTNSVPILCAPKPSLHPLKPKSAVVNSLCTQLQENGTTVHVSASPTKKMIHKWTNRGRPKVRPSLRTAAKRRKILPKVAVSNNAASHPQVPCADSASVETPVDARPGVDTANLKTECTISECKENSFPW